MYKVFLQKGNLKPANKPAKVSKTRA